MSALTSQPAAAETSVSPHAALKLLSHVCFVAGFLSILASIAVWFSSSIPDLGHRERLAVFVGLWPPTFFALSARLERYVKSLGR